jgi:hypothetical protein
MSLHSLSRGVAAALLLTCLPLAQAQLRLLDNYSPTTQYGNDDDSTDALSFGFSVNLFGSNYSELYINNNGNVTFAFPSGLGNPSSINDGLAQQGGPVLAPFFADVDTTYAGALSYGMGMIGTFNAFVVNWTDVASYTSGLQSRLQNTFQLFMVDRSDTGAGNFDFEFNYTKIQWDVGTNSNGVTALAGFSDAASTNFLLPGSGISGSFLDSGPSDKSLIHNMLGNPFDGASMDGRYAFNVRNGLASFTDPDQSGGGGNGGGGTPSVPDHGPAGLGAGFLAAMVLLHRSKQTRSTK